MSEAGAEEIRKDFLRKLQEEVDMAYEKRALETYIKDEDTTEEQLEIYKKIYEDLKDKPDDEILDSETYVKRDCEVVVATPQDYQDLLRMAVLKIFPGDEDFATIEARNMYRHEEAHFKVLSDNQIKFVLGVHFFQDKRTGATNFNPVVFNEGKISVGTYRAALNAASKPSSGDQALLGKK